MIRELVEKIRQKDLELQQLQQQLNGRDLDRPNDCCSLFPSSSTSRVEERQRYFQSASEMGSCLRNESCSRERRGSGVGTSASEIASCSSTPAPIPPKRILKKKMSCEDRINLRGGWWGPERCDASVQRPTRRDASTHHVTLARDRAPAHDRDCDTADERDTTPVRSAAQDRDTARHCARCVVSHVRPRGDRHTRAVSPSEQMFSRLESMSAALADSYRRWTRTRRADIR